MSFRRTPCPKCPQCRAKLEQGQRIHPECVSAYADARAEKAERARAKKARLDAKVERAEIRRREEQIKTRAQWLAECQAVINRYVRLRDAGKPCVSCDRPASWEGQWHASHLRSVGAASAVRFHLWNIHKACSICNHHLSGNVAEYLPRVRARIGDNKVAWLYDQNQLVRYDVAYLKRLKAVMGSRLRRLEKRFEQT